MSTSAILLQLEERKKAATLLEEQLPFVPRMKYRYWGPKAKLVLWGWVIKTLAVAGLVWGKVAMASFVMNHPVAAAVLQRTAENVKVFAIGAIAVAFNPTS